MFCRNTNLPTYSENLLAKKKAGNTSLISLILVILFMCIGSSYTYAQTDDSTVIDYKTDTTHHFVVTKSGLVGVGTGTPQVQFHTTGTVRFAKFKNNTYEDSVLTTDANGNLKFVAKCCNNTWGGIVRGPAEVKFYANDPAWQGRITWSGYDLNFSTTDSTRPNSYQRLTLYPEEKNFQLVTSDGQNNAGIWGEAYEGSQRLSLSAGRSGLEKGINITPDNISLRGYNNASENMVLTTDVNGNLKLIPKCCTSITESFKNSIWGDSVLSTDVNGNLKLVPKWAGSTISNGEINFYNEVDEVFYSKMRWNNGSLALSSYDQNQNSMQVISIVPDEGNFHLKSEGGNSVAQITGNAGYGNSSLYLLAGGNNKYNSILVSPDNIQFEKFTNNISEDSVLTTDANGNLKFKYITCCENSQSKGDSSWAWSDTNTIYNRNKGNVGIGTLFPTAKFHAKGSIRFESFKNNLQGDSVLTTDEYGNLKFVYMPYGSSGGGGGASYNFQNGVTQSNGNVSLGGQLQDSVKINLSGNQISFNNGAEKVMHMSAEGNVGVGARADAGYKLNVYGDVVIGHDYDKISKNEKLSFGGTSNTDPLYLQRYNLAYDVTDLRMNIGDDGGASDRFIVGYIPKGTTNWVDAMVVEAGGNVGIGTDQIPGQLSVGKGHGIKLAVGNGQWAQSAIIKTSNDNTNGDFTDLMVPGSVTNTSILRLTQAGNVGIGTLVPDAQYKLSVNGRIRAKGLRVQSAGWSDFVFEPNYKLLSLTELEKFIKANKHLPEIPTTKEVMRDGQEVGEIQSKLLQKIEELTLYTIELNNQVKVLEDKNKKLEAQQQQISTMQQQLDELKKLIKNK